MIIKRDFIYSPKGTSRPLHIYLPDNYFESDQRYLLQQEAIHYQLYKKLN